MVLRYALAAGLLAATVPVVGGTPNEVNSDAPASVESQVGAIMKVYRSRSEGARLYDARDYDGAYPHLMNAAMHGLKDSQARLGFMHLSGLGPAKKDARLAVGWLGVAADGTTRPDIRKVFKDVYGKIPQAHRTGFDRVIDKFVAAYGSAANDVKCRRVNRKGSKIRVLNCLIADPDGYLVADSLERVARELMPGQSSQSTALIWEPREGFGSMPERSR